MQALDWHADLTVEGFRLREGEKPTDAHFANQEAEIGLMPRGTAEGRPTVMLKARTAGGELVIVETTLRLLATAVDAMRAYQAGEEQRN